MNNNEKGLDKLIAWKKAIGLVELVYKDILPLLPPDERWSLAQQIRRSSQSIPANIAEGYGRYYYQDNVRFCYIARGSLEETYSHIRVAIQLGYITESSANNVMKAIDELKKILNGYIQFIKSSKQGESETAQYSAKSIRETESDFFEVLENELLE